MKRAKRLTRKDKINLSRELKKKKMILEKGQIKMVNCMLCNHYFDHTQHDKCPSCLGSLEKVNQKENNQEQNNVY